MLVYSGPLVVSWSCQLTCQHTVYCSINARTQCCRRRYRYSISHLIYRITRCRCMKSDWEVKEKCVTGWSTDRRRSNTTSRLLKVDAGWMAMPETLTDCMSSTQLRPRPSNNWMASVCDGFSASPLCNNHACTLRMHCSSTDSCTYESSLEIAIYKSNCSNANHQPFRWPCDIWRRQVASAGPRSNLRCHTAPQHGRDQNTPSPSELATELTKSSFLSRRLLTSSKTRWTPELR